MDFVCTDNILGLFLTTRTFSFSQPLNRHDQLPREEECRLQALLRSLQVFPSLVWLIWIVPTRLGISSFRICRFDTKESTGFVLPCTKRPKRRFTHFRQIPWSRGNGLRTDWMLSLRHSLFSQPRSFLDWLRAPLCRGSWLSRVAVFVSDEM